MGNLNKEFLDATMKNYNAIGKELLRIHDLICRATDNLDGNGDFLDGFCLREDKPDWEKDVIDEIKSWKYDSNPHKIDIHFAGSETYRYYNEKITYYPVDMICNEPVIEVSGWKWDEYEGPGQESFYIPAKYLDMTDEEIKNDLTEWYMRTYKDTIEQKKRDDAEREERLKERAKKTKYDWKVGDDDRER